MGELGDWLPLARTVHLLGLLVGGGGALASDAGFGWCLLRHGEVRSAEARLLRVGEGLVWLGLALLAGSGLVMLLEHPGAYLALGRFRAKLCVVALLVANGLVIARVVLPRIERGAWRERAALVLATGAVSVASWLTALVLGASLAGGWGAGLGGAASGALYVALLAAGGLNAALLFRRRVSAPRRAAEGGAPLSSQAPR